MNSGAAAAGGGGGGEDKKLTGGWLMKTPSKENFGTENVCQIQAFFTFRANRPSNTTERKFSIPLMNFFHSEKNLKMTS